MLRMEGVASITARGLGCKGSSLLQNQYSLDKEKATRLYIHMGIYSHGITVLRANKTCIFSEQEIEKMSDEVFISVLYSIQKEGGKSSAKNIKR